MQVDHTGVSNSQLVKEQAAIAVAYNGKSVAEQNSIDLAWNILLDPKYTDLRDSIYTNQAEYTQFRQLVVNVVLATDIFDQELSELRKNRWNKVFDVASLEEPMANGVNRKATVVIEHMIQASDVAHTMQHASLFNNI